MTLISIPATLDEERKIEDAEGRLLTAKGWERAARVFAFTYEPGRGGDRRSNQSRQSNFDRGKTAKGFADLGIFGLTAASTVYEYRRNWQYAIEQGWATVVEPGDAFDFPALDEEPYPPRVAEKAPPLVVEEKTLEEKTREVRRTLAEEPEVQQRIETDFVRRASKDSRLAAHVKRAWEEQHPTPSPPSPPPPEARRGLARLDLFEVGGTLVRNVERERENVAFLARYLEANRPLSARDEKLVAEVFREIERARTALSRYEDLLYDALGVSRDDVARRLVASLD
jgi:hypothetical protein